MDAIELHRDGAVARLLINQPSTRNAICRSMWRTITLQCTRLAADHSVRAITLESAIPGSFSSGADISEFEANYADAATTAEVNAEMRDAIESVAACPQPVIALVDGICVGGGIALLLACDIRLCNESARFALTPARIGLSYDPADIRRLLAAVGRGVASEMLFGGEMWSARRVWEAGLVNSVFTDEEFVPQSNALIDAICANSRSANEILKRSLSDVESGDADRFDRARKAFSEQFSSADFIEGRDAFLEKRTALFPSHSN